MSDKEENRLIAKMERFIEGLKFLTETRRKCGKEKT